MFTAKSVMTKDAVTVKRETEIYEAVRLMVENNVTGLPVVNDDLTLAGIVSEKDVLKLLYDKAGGRHKVEDYMTKEVVSFDQEDSLFDITESLLKNRFRRVPILDGRKLVGIVSRRDIIAYLFRLRNKRKAAV